MAARARQGGSPPAAMAVDLYGQCCDYAAIVAVCVEHGVPLIEDAAEALGATYRDRPAGSFGDAAIFSFNGNKIVTASGGGMLVTAHPSLADRARYLATQARQPAAHYEHTEIGSNYRLSNVLAALGAGPARPPRRPGRPTPGVQPSLREALAGVDGVEFMPEADRCRSAFWLTCLTIDPAQAGTDRETARLALERADIESRPVWKPMHRQPAYVDAPARLTGVLDRSFELGLCLPSGSGMSDEQFDFVVEHLVAAFDVG